MVWTFDTGGGGQEAKAVNGSSTVRGKNQRYTKESLYGWHRCDSKEK